MSDKTKKQLVNYGEGYRGMMPGAVKLDLRNGNSFTIGGDGRARTKRRWVESSVSLNDVFPSDRQP